MWNSSLQRKTPMKRSKSDRSQGLGHKVAVTLNFLRPLGHKESTLFRSLQHRMNVATLACVGCGRLGPSQCAHANYTKAMGSKVSDLLTFPLCPNCHRAHDQGGMPRDTRRRLESGYILITRMNIQSMGEWTPEMAQRFLVDFAPFERLAA